MLPSERDELSEALASIRAARDEHAASLQHDVARISADLIAAQEEQRRLGRRFIRPGDTAAELGGVSHDRPAA